MRVPETSEGVDLLENDHGEVDYAENDGNQQQEGEHDEDVPCPLEVQDVAADCHDSWVAAERTGEGVEPCEGRVHIPCHIFEHQSMRDGQRRYLVVQKPEEILKQSHHQTRSEGSVQDQVRSGMRPKRYHYMD